MPLQDPQPQQIAPPKAAPLTQCADLEVDASLSAGFLQRRLDSTKSLIDTYRSYRLVGFGLRTIEQGPINNLIRNYGQPVVQQLDRGLSQAYKQLEDNVVVPAKAGWVNGASVAVGSAWFKNVDSILQAQVGSRRAQFERFFDTAVDTYATLEQKTFEDFAVALQSRMPTWDDKLLAPAKTFFARSQAALEGLELQERANPDAIKGYLAGVVQGMFVTWEKSAVGVNALSLYNAALDRYLEDDAEHKPTPTELVASMKKRLGSAWSDQLVTPLTVFFASIKDVARKDLERPKNTLSQAVRGLSGIVQHRFNQIKSYSSKTLDYVLPEEQEEQQQEDKENEVPSLQVLRQRVTKRLRERASGKMGDLRTFSSTRLQSLIHVDIIAYAEQLVDQADKHLPKISISETQEKLSSAVETCKHSLADVRSSVSSKASPHMQAIRERFQVAMAEARELGNLSLRVVSAHKVMHLPKDVYSLFSQAVGLSSTGKDFDLVASKCKTLGASLANLVFWWRQFELEQQQQGEEQAKAAQQTNMTPQPWPMPAKQEEEEEEEDEDEEVAEVVETSADAPLEAVKEEDQPQANSQEKPEQQQKQKQESVQSNKKNKKNKNKNH